MSPAVFQKAILVSCSFYRPKPYYAIFNKDMSSPRTKQNMDAQAEARFPEFRPVSGVIGCPRPPSYLHTGLLVAQESLLICHCKLSVCSAFVTSARRIIISEVSFTLKFESVSMCVCAYVITCVCIVCLVIRCSQDVNDQVIARAFICFNHLTDQVCASLRLRASYDHKQGLMALRRNDSDLN